MKNRKQFLTIALFSSMLLGFSLVSWFRTPDAFSDAERRSLTQRPKFTSSALTDGSFMKKFEDYSMDQFPLRDGFRSLKAMTGKYILGQKDNHGLYSVDGVLSKLEYPLNERKVSASLGKLEQIYKTFLKDTDCKPYFSLIPDKNAFLAPMGGYPAMDYGALTEKVRAGISYAEYIDIADLLTLEDYYRTDQHWKQECIPDIADRIGAFMNPDSTGYLPDSFETKTLDTPFYGAYVGQSALPFEADTIQYLTNPELEACYVTDYNSGTARESSIYDYNKASGKDPYEFFLSGATPLLVIENPQASSDRELVVFRDSFGSSLIPLLTARYAKITVVDLRYMRSNLLSQYVNFDEQDVLFLYSTLILNNTISM